MEKRSRQKELILWVLQSNHFHPTAVWIYDQARTEFPNISLATVYRNLRLLRKNGELLELHFEDGLSHFDIRTDKHEHFWCDKCNRIFDIDEPVNKKLNGQVARKTGFKILYSQIVFHGACRECQLVLTVSQ